MLQGLYQSTQDGFTQDVYQADLITYSYSHLIIGISAFPSSEKRAIATVSSRTSNEN